MISRNWRHMSLRDLSCFSRFDRAYHFSLISETNSCSRNHIRSLERFLVVHGAFIFPSSDYTGNCCYRDRDRFTTLKLSQKLEDETFLIRFSSVTPVTRLEIPRFERIGSFGRWYQRSESIRRARRSHEDISSLPPARWANIQLRALSSSPGQSRRTYFQGKQLHLCFIHFSN